MQLRSRAATDHTSLSPGRLYPLVLLVRELFFRLVLAGCLLCGVLLLIVAVANSGIDVASLTDEPSRLNSQDARSPSIYSLALTADESQMLVIENPGTLVVRDLATHQEMDRFGIPGDLVICMVYSPVRRQAIVGTANGNLILLSDGTSQSITITKAHHESFVRTLAVSPDGRVLASGGNDGLRLWQADSGEPRELPQDAALPICCLQFSPDGSLLLAGCYNGQVLGWDVATGKQRFRFALLEDLKTHVKAVEFSPDGKQICAATLDGIVGVWDLASQTCLWHQHPHSIYALTIAFTPDGRLVASCGIPDSRILVWHAETGEPVTELCGHQDGVRTLVFSSDGRTLFSGSYDGTIRRWHVPRLPERE